MEVVMSEEKKKIFRARKTMKISDRQQLETLHSTLLTSPSGLSNSPPPPLMNGTHKEDGQKPGDKEQVDLESKSPNATTPTSPTPFLSLNLSPSPASSDGSKTKEDPLASPGSPFHSLNSELKKLENSDNMGSSSPTSNLDIPAPSESEKVQENSDEPVAEGKKVESETKEDLASLKSVKDTDAMLSHSPVGPPGCSEPMETDSHNSKPVDAVVADDTTDKNTDEKPSSPKSSNNVPPSPSPAATVTEQEDQKEGIKKEKDTAEELKKEPVKETKNIEVKKEIKKEKHKINKQSRPSSTPPSNTEEKSSTSGLKRTLSEGFDPNDCSLNKDIKRRKTEGEEFEAQLEFKITAKAGGHRKLEKIVQKILEEKLRVLELTIFDKNLQELKDRVDQIECATKHQTAINTLQVKLARLAKKFGEANQASENKKKQEALAAAAAAAAAAANAATTNTTPAAVAPPTKTVSNSPQTQRPMRTSVEVKQTTGTAHLTSSSAPGSAASSVSVPVSSNASLVSQTPILQLIASTSNAVSNLTASTTQSSPGTLLLKTAPGSGVMATGQPLLIQLPLSMANGQTGTLVNIPVSTFNAATSLNKSKTTAPTTTFILKSAPTSTSTASSLTTVPALTASTSHVPTTQISLARAVYQGGAGGITTPNAGISVSTARAATQAVSVVGAMSSASSPVTSGPAATGSTAPGTPQGTSLTTKTDNQATASTPSKVPAPTARPKGSVIDLTEEDDDVLVTGVKSATTPNATRPQTSIPSAARSSPQSTQNSTGNLQLTAHHRPPLDLASKSRTTSNSTPTRAGSVSLPPLPVAPVPPRLPPEAEKTSPPQQPQLKLVPSPTGIVLSWCVAETDTTCAAVDSYHLYAFHQDNSNSNPSQQHWKKIGEVKALPLPMACTLTQFQSGSTYHFAVRAKDIYGRFGAFCEPQCTNVISSSSS